MPTVHVDQQQVVFGDVSCSDTDDSPVETSCFVVPVIIPEDQIGAWEAAYDPSSPTSPSEADCRVIARAVLDGMKKAAEGQ